MIDSKCTKCGKLFMLRKHCESRTCPWILCSECREDVRHGS